MVFDFKFSDIINGVAIVAAGKGTLEITRSDEYGNKGTFKRIGYKTRSLSRAIAVSWHAPTSKTVFRFKINCKSGKGGFIAQIRYKGIEYVTNKGYNNYKLIYSDYGKKEITESYVADIIPGGITNNKARWIWNDENINSIIFEFDMENIIYDQYSVGNNNNQRDSFYNVPQLLQLQCNNVCLYDIDCHKRNSYYDLFTRRDMDPVIDPKIIRLEKQPYAIEYYTSIPGDFRELLMTGKFSDYHMNNNNQNQQQAQLQQQQAQDKAYAFIVLSNDPEQIRYSNSLSHTQMIRYEEFDEIENGQIKVVYCGHFYQKGKEWDNFSNDFMPKVFSTTGEHFNYAKMFSDYWGFEFATFIPYKPSEEINDKRMNKRAAVEVDRMPTSSVYKYSMDQIHIDSPMNAYRDIGGWERHTFITNNPFSQIVGQINNFGNNMVKQFFAHQSMEDDDDLLSN